MTNVADQDNLIATLVNAAPTPTITGSTLFGRDLFGVSAIGNLSGAITIFAATNQTLLLEQSLEAIQMTMKVADDKSGLIGHD